MKKAILIITFFYVGNLCAVGGFGVSFSQQELLRTRDALSSKYKAEWDVSSLEVKYNTLIVQKGLEATIQKSKKMDPSLVDRAFLAAKHMQIGKLSEGIENSFSTK